MRGATVDMDDIDHVRSAVQKVQQITRDMENGEYEPDSDYESEEEETPRIIEMYDMACAALNGTHQQHMTYQQMSNSRSSTRARSYTHHIITALTAMTGQHNQSQVMKHGHSSNQSNFAIKEAFCTKPGLRAKGNTHRHSGK